MASTVNDLYRTYWSKFRKSLVACNPPFSPLRSPAGKSPARYPLVWIVNDNIWLKVEVACSLQNRWIFAQIALIKTDKWKSYERLKRQSGVIESNLEELRVDENLDWDPHPGTDTPQIRLTHDAIDIQNRSQWDTQHQWLSDRAIALWKVFSKQLPELR